jgi:hypothetical protein
MGFQAQRDLSEKTGFTCVMVINRKQKIGMCNLLRSGGEVMNASFMGGKSFALKIINTTKVR